MRIFFVKVQRIKNVLLAKKARISNRVIVER